MDCRAFLASLEAPNVIDVEGNRHEGKILSALEYARFQQEYEVVIAKLLAEDGGLVVEEAHALARAIATAIELPAPGLAAILALPVAGLARAIIDLLGCCRGREKQERQAVAPSASPSPLPSS